MSKPRGPRTAEAIRRGVVREIRAGGVTGQASATRLEVSLPHCREVQRSAPTPGRGRGRGQVGGGVTIDSTAA